MNDHKIQLLAKWFTNPDKRYWNGDDPDIETIDKLCVIAAKAYDDGGRFSEGAKAAAEVVIRYVIEMQ